MRWEWPVIEEASYSDREGSCRDLRSMPGEEVGTFSEACQGAAACGTATLEYTHDDHATLEPVARLATASPGLSKSRERRHPAAYSHLHQSVAWVAFGVEG